MLDGKTDCTHKPVEKGPHNQGLYDLIISEAEYIQATIPKPEDMAINFLKGRQKVGDLYESRYEMSNDDICRNIGTDLKVLILITSAPAYIDNRQTIRLTWGHLTARIDVFLAFVFGNTTLKNKKNPRI